MTSAVQSHSEIHDLDGLQPPSVFSTAEWRQAWWDVFGRGKLLTTIEKESDRPVAFAPFYADSGMIYLVGSGASDYLDLIGDVSGDRLPRMLRAASDQVSDFQGVVFYHLPESSLTTTLLQAAAQTLGWRLFEEAEQSAPAMDLIAHPAEALAATRKKSLIRHENALRKAGYVEVHHFRTGSEIAPQLDPFFEQHIARWAATPYPSLFLNAKNRAFYRRLCEIAGDTGWLRFTRVDLDGRAVAYHFGFCYRGIYLWYKPTFDIQLAKLSPGEVLLRQLLLAAVNENAKVFDFGLGDEAFKARFATHVNKVRNWGLYPPEKC